MGSPWNSQVTTESTTNLFPIYNPNYGSNNGPFLNGVPVDYAYVSVSRDSDSGFFEGEDANGVSSISGNTNGNVNCNYQDNYPNSVKVPLPSKRVSLPLSAFEESKRIKRYKSSCTSGTIFLREIPTWSIYFNDQKNRIAKFSDNTRQLWIEKDPQINQKVSLCFYKNAGVKLKVDVAVCSTTRNYSGVSGLDKAIHLEAGPELRDACNRLQPIDIGDVGVTQGFNLPAQYIFHANGPLGPSTQENHVGIENLLRKCYETCLNLMVQRDLKTLAFPCISTGQKGVQKHLAAEIALLTVRNFLDQHKTKVDRIIFCLHNKKDIDIYVRLMQIYFPVE